MRAWPAALTPVRAARLFAASNIAFLGLDIALAHRENDFAHPAEWAPVVFSLLAGLLLAPGALGVERAWVVALDRAVAVGAVALGVAGLVFHLQSAFFEDQTLRNLVYAAPFAAPLAYVGVGLLILLVLGEEAATPALGPWILLLALGGFVGNLALSLLDHAQNGFFRASEWLAVGAAAFGVSFLLLTLLRPSLAMIKICLAVMGAELAMGALGFVLHVEANLHRLGSSLLERFTFGAPAFAPLLFADLALLGAIGLWATQRTLRAE